MTAAEKLNLISVEDYLAGELVSSIKHEYIAGVVYAMAGARNVHKTIANAIGALQPSSWPPLPDVQLRHEDSLSPADRTRGFTIPMPSVVCQQNPPEDSFQDDPVVIWKLLSRATRRIDDGEKKDAYLTIPTLAVYLLVEQETAAVIAYRRSDQGSSGNL